MLYESLESQIVLVVGLALATITSILLFRRWDKQERQTQPSVKESLD